MTDTVEIVRLRNERNAALDQLERIRDEAECELISDELEQLIIDGQTIVDTIRGHDEAKSHVQRRMTNREGGTMTETKWTPGPWRVTGWDEKTSQALIHMDCNPPDRPDSWRWSGWVSTRTEANARLIAAAPSMAEYIIERARAGDNKAIAIAEMFGATI